MYELSRTSSFKRQFKKYTSNKKAIESLKELLSFFVKGKDIPQKYKDHKLKGNFVAYRECHILFDILLVYKINEQKRLITLVYIGSHSQLFG